MRRYCLFGLLCLLMACSEEKTDLTGNTPITINDFNKIFKVVVLPVTIADTNLNRFTDTLVIGRKALTQFIPDSIVENIVSKKDKKAIVQPIFKIEKEDFMMQVK